MAVLGEKNGQLSCFLFRPLKIGRNFLFGCVSVFSFFPHAKLVATNSHQRELSDISYKRPYSRELSDIKKFYKKFSQLREKPVL